MLDFDASSYDLREVSMATYKYSEWVTQLNHDAFDTKHPPGATAPFAGIYRCTGCGWEIAIAGGHVLPAQNHHQHSGSAKIEWQLVVYAVHKG
jgi:hypothetical protein